MTESEFGEILKEKLRKNLSSRYQVSTKENLLYKVIVGENGEYKPGNPRGATRGNLAFQTDLLIKRDSPPLVAAELKYGSFTTHDVLIYSAKALKHKAVYPYLRYGFIVLAALITNKFFVHNEGFDFALALDNTDAEEMARLVKIIKAQIKIAELLLNQQSEKRNIKCFNQHLELENA